MKVAGRKNDGAWYRANLTIKSLSSSERDALKTKLESMTSISNFLTAIQDLYDDAGLSGDANRPADVNAVAANYSTTGIPRQAWFGVLSWDTYDVTVIGGTNKYNPTHRSAAFEFGKEIRKLMKTFTFARRQAKDLTNLANRSEGNPGGIADASAGN